MIKTDSSIQTVLSFERKQKQSRKNSEPEKKRKTGAVFFRKGRRIKIRGGFIKSSGKGRRLMMAGMIFSGMAVKAGQQKGAAA